MQYDILKTVLLWEMKKSAILLIWNTQNYEPAIQEVRN